VIIALGALTLLVWRWKGIGSVNTGMTGVLRVFQFQMSPPLLPASLAAAVSRIVSHSDAGVFRLS